ncbi:MAG TPA: dihydroneopterin aldolase [Candidatus Paceibacterota bacterium]|nr:dihydroneopterin aldolase [Candidatus Paceibacterota bacterium]
MSFTSTSTTVMVEDFRVEAFVGQHAPEREQLQVVSVSIICTLINPAVINDELENSFDYVPIVEEVKALAVSRKRRLIETFAEEIAKACFAYPHVKSAVVSIRKPHKLPSVAAVGIERTFERRS